MKNRIAASLALGLAIAANAGAPWTFRVHTINADSRFEAASLADLSGDGRPDIFSGGFWYEAPKWTKHFVREVEEKGGYHVDFGAHPADVDGDGKTDIINAAWHNKAVFWLRNPGKAGEPWPVHMVDTPGNIETLIPADLNGDGRMDIMPNVVGKPAWYEFAADASASNGARWTKHDLPGQAGAHGMGVGDVNADGRPDIVTPRGWLEGSATGWVWHAEYDVKERASIPMLVGDIDGDGDGDIVWGSAHGYGVNWLEQGRGPDGARTWTRREIDTRWSQAHFLVFADLDNDGVAEIVTGKRYYAHNGKDPGAEDPKCVYAYDYDRAAKTWTRHTLSEGGQVGFGIFTNVADFDGDGDLDVLCPGKSGLYLIENLLK